MSDTISLTEVNSLIKSANVGYTTILKRLDSLDYNLLTDMNVLIDKQVDVIETIKILTNAVTALHTKQQPIVKVVKMKRAKIGVILVAGIYIGYQLGQPAQPKKEK